MRPPFQPSREGPRKPEGGPEAPQECFHKELRSALENRGVAGATGGGNEESCSIRSKKKKGTDRAGGLAAPNPREVSHLSLRNQVTCLV